MKAQQGHLHFLGIAGHTMRGIALACQRLGYRVTGTDETAYPPGSDWLDRQGMKWWRMSDPAHVQGATQVIISGHIAGGHPELAEARRLRLPVRSFAELIGELAASQRRIVVAGTHGKTTTTSLIAWLLESAGRQPDFLAGIQPNNFDTSVRLALAGPGTGRAGGVMVIEGDEYRASQLDERSKFAFYEPDVLVLTSIEMDHPDLFKDIAEIKQRFEQLAGGLPPDGRLYYWAESALVREVGSQASAPGMSYGLSRGDWQAHAVTYTPAGTEFDLFRGGDLLGRLNVPLYGQHNVLNSLAAVAVAMGEGVTLEQIAEGLAGFKGASRRFERVPGQGAAVTVIDDYAHHPTEVKTTIEAVRLHFKGAERSGRVIAVFRPHTYSRTLALLPQYQAAFAAADRVFIAEIEGAREQHLAASVNGVDVARAAGEHAAYEPDRAKLMEAVLAAAGPGDTVLCMSVNGYDGFAQEVARRLG
ncbi:UDP-N-acetylmuramate:L-alanyl-gamma-D-glutamyl-meso-diaminopimelate ligase [Candidatus Parcubacteria bacterium]|nr:UDP-N-acetylmuramate:L-alanyl-gamma-D-glutamyl-meso-diaminopimelate ligase [Candidatus Parcubacteria bacterium]